MQMIHQIENMVHVIRIDRHGYGLKGTQSGLLQTDDFGETWQTTRIVRPVTTLLQLQGKILVGSAGAIYLSEDQGISWQSPQAFHPSTIVSGFALCEGHFLASTLEDGVLVSEDGLSWRGFNFGLLDWNVLSLKVSISGTAFAGTESGIFKSINGGRTWQMLSAPLDSPVLSLGCYEGVLFAGTESGALLQSDDSGLSWAILKTGGDAINAIEINNRGMMAVLQGDIISISDDGGQTCWRVDCDIVQISTLSWMNTQQLLIGTHAGDIVPLSIAEHKD